MIGAGESRSGRLWSLLDMINFRFGAAHSCLTLLNNLITASNKNSKIAIEYGGGNYVYADEKFITQAKDVADAATKQFEQLKSEHVNVSGRRLKAHLRREKLEWSDINALVTAFRDNVEVELSQHWFYRYDKNKGNQFSTWKETWKTALTAFPAIHEDAFSASDCYALEHYTASVFHSMRIVEHGLRALAKERNIKLKNDKPIEWATWMDLIKELDREIVIIGNQQAGAKRDAALEFYSGLRADLNGFKDEYRNAVMHVRRSYDEFQSLRALVKVREFMERVSARIDEKHQAINWDVF